MAETPKRPDTGQRPQGGRENERTERGNREGERPTEQPAAEARANRRQKKSGNKLTLYMRGVAVASLLIVGGVGVYKGRNMLGAKEVPKTNTAATDPKAKSDSPTTVANTATTKSDTKPTTKLTGPALSGINKSTVSTPTNTASKSTSTDKKVSALGKFKFGGTKSTDSKPKPAAESTSSGEYSLSDDPSPTPADSGYSGNVADSGYSASPAAAADAGEYGGYSADPAPAAVADADSGYSASADATSAPPDSEYGATVTDAAPATETEGYQGTSDGYGAAAEPAPEAPSYSATDDGYAAATSEPEPQPATASEPSPALAAPPASKFGSLPKSKFSSGTSKFGQPAASSNAATQEQSAEPAPTMSGFGSPPNRFSGNTTSSPLPKNSLPSNSLPSNSLPKNTFGSSAAPAPASTAGRYTQEADITPITSQDVPPEMEGPQTPAIVVEKFAPPEVQVGRAALFEIVVKNVGKVPAYDVTVVDQIPSGTRFQQASPQASQAKNGSLVWKLGSMKPGEEKVIELQLVPEAEGEIGSVAQVSFQAQAGAKSIVTRPRLEVRHEAPEQIHADDNATVRLTITNTGTGAASNVLLQSDVPEVFTHPAGRELEFEVGTVRPGESKQVELILKAEQAGQYQGVFVVQADGDISVQDSAQIEIIAPSLQVAVSGPKKRFVERQATHTITFANPGTAAAKDVDLIAYLPRGFKFVSTDHGGQYNSTQHAVVWGVEELPPSAQASVQLTTLPVEAGEQKLRVEARSANGLSADFEQLVAVDAIAELPFTISDLADPIEVGSETGYEIRLSNRGAKDATNVVINVAFPPELKPIAGEGDARATVTGQNVQFDPIDRIAPGSEIILRVQAQGLRAGDHRIAVSLTSDETKTPVTREESTRVYADQ